MVSAAKLRKAQDAILQLRPFYIKLHEILKRVSSGVDENHHNVFTRSSDTGRILFIVITSNRGLCGAFNTNIVKRTIQSIHQQYAEAYRNGKVDIIAVGKKGADQLKGRNYKIEATHHHLFDKLTFDNVSLLTFDRVSALADKLMRLYVSKEYDTIEIVYNQFKNAAVQDITEEFLLPLLPETEVEEKFETPVDYILEPSEAEILNEMIPYALKVQFFRSLLESNAAEHGARMTAMHKATDNATELIRELELNYNKARQAAITGEILEIVGGAEALKE